MSQLNNEEKNEVIKEENLEVTEVEENNEKETSVNEPKPKMSVKKKIIIFLIVFTIIAVGITTAAIIVNNSAKKDKIIENEEKKEEIVPDGLGIKSLTDKYNLNDLKIIDIEEGIGSRVPTSEWDTNTSKVKMNYIQIDGLKNAKIENQINNEIKEKVYSLFSEGDLNNNDIDSIQIYANISANFGNVVSISIHKVMSYKETQNNIYGYDNREYLNYDLATGNRLKFMDLFTNTASIKNILTQSIYDSLISKYSNDISQSLGTYSVDLGKNDMSHIEDETFIILNKCISNLENLNFGFDAREIYINGEGQGITIQMPNVYSDIAIYNRFIKSESIFDSSYEGMKNLFVFNYVDLEWYYAENDQKYVILDDIYENLRIEVSVSCVEKLYNQAEGKKLYDSYVRKAKEDVDILKNEALANPEKAILYTAKYSMHVSENTNLTSMGIQNSFVDLYGNSTIYRMSKQYYDEIFYNKIAESTRGGDGAIA